MSPASVLMDELQARGIELQAHGGRLRFRPQAAMTADLAGRVKACKGELLALLDAPPAPEPETHADREARRFIAVCRPWPDGRGWYDPAQAPTAAALARADDSPQAPPKRIGRQPDLFDRPGGGKETFAERAAQYRAGWERGGYPPGVLPARLDNPADRLHNVSTKGDRCM